MDEVKSFFQELEALCEKYNAKILGCGCCGSPFGKVGKFSFIELCVNGTGSSYSIERSLEKSNEKLSKLGIKNGTKI